MSENSTATPLETDIHFDCLGQVNRYDYITAIFEVEPEGFRVRVFRSEHGEYHSESGVITNENAKELIDFLTTHLKEKEQNNALRRAE